VLRVFVVLSLLTVALISCSTTPSTSPSPATATSAVSSNYSDRRVIGELVVNDRFIIIGTPDILPAESTLWPGRFPARLDRLQRDVIVIDVDAPGIGDLTVRLEDGAGEFPVGEGGFTFTASQHDLPYTIHGEHAVTRELQGTNTFREVCYRDMLQQLCTTTTDGETYCSVYTVRVPGVQWIESRVTLESESLDMTFVDAEASVVVAQFSAFNEPRLEERLSRVGFCE
jgi:hypothetical protein